MFECDIIVDPVAPADPTTDSSLVHLDLVGAWKTPVSDFIPVQDGSDLVDRPDNGVVRCVTFVLCSLR